MSRPYLVQENPGGDGDVQRLRTIGHRDRNESVDRRPHRISETCAFIADDDAQTGRWTLNAEDFAAGGRAPQAHAVLRPERQELVPGTVEGRKVEMRTHPATDDFGVP